MLELATSWRERRDGISSRWYMGIELEERFAWITGSRESNGIKASKVQLTDLRVLRIAEQREPVVNLFHFDCDRGGRLMVTA